MKTYNGWENRATWNVHLWLSNDEGLYHMALDAGRDGVDAVKDLCMEVWPGGRTPDGDRLLDVPASGWEHIAEAFAPESQ